MSAATLLGPDLVTTYFCSFSLDGNCRWQSRHAIFSQSVSCSSGGAACADAAAAAAAGLDCGCSSSAESEPYPVSLSSPPTLSDDVEAISGIGLLSMMEKARSSDLCGAKLF